MDNFEKKWQMIQDQLMYEIQGKRPCMISSGRTLFGIRSSVEEMMDRVAKEFEEDQLLKAAQKTQLMQQSVTGDVSETQRENLCKAAQ